MIVESSKRYIFVACFVCLTLLAWISVSIMYYLEGAEDPRFHLPNLAMLHLIWYGIGIIGFFFILAKSQFIWLGRIFFGLSTAILIGSFLQGEVHHDLPYFQFGAFYINAAEASALGLLIPIASMLANSYKRFWLIFVIMSIFSFFAWIGSENALLCLGFSISAMVFLDYLSRCQKKICLLSISLLVASIFLVLRKAFLMVKDSSIQVFGFHSLVLYDLGAEANGHTEFILSHIVEQFGIVVACFSILLIVLFVVQIVALSAIKVEREARFMATGFGAFLVGQVLFNLLVVAGVVGNPASGVSLPFISYGGSQLVLELAITGAILGYCIKPAQKKENRRQQNPNFIQSK